MRAHLPITAEEREWRDHHMGLVVESRHLATPATTLANVGHGWDVSAYQPDGVDFTGGGRKVAAFKATESLSYFNSRNFTANRNSAHAREDQLVAIVIYHFARPANKGGGDQARYMLSKIGPRQRKEVIALDFEVSPWLTQWAIDFLTVIHTEGHYPTEFYSYLGMISSNDTRGIPDTGCGLWPAAYGTREPGNDRWTAGKDGWQHTDGQPSVPGNDGPWDCSQWDLVKLAARVGSPAPGPTPTPQPSSSRRKQLLRAQVLNN
jgi:GH25 family lysozyme M1 (1,4-beta-N-acetylmuramidase)